MPRYTLIVEYVGKNYAGSQIQPDGVDTIQFRIENALRTLKSGKRGNGYESMQPPKCQKYKSQTIFSGRTDKGVNSKGQVVHFDCEEILVASKFLHSMNALLPDDISVLGLNQVDEGFHAQKSAKKRHYKYVFFNRELKSAFDGGLMLIKYEIDIERMNNSLKYLLGQHDFSAFKSAGTNNPNPVCTLYKAEAKRLGDTVVIDIVGNRFLYNMVRTIVGSLLLIEKENLLPEKMLEILDGKDRTKAGKTVNPYGLTLMKVEY